MEELGKVKETWNTKRILITLAVIAFLIISAYFFKDFVLGKSKELLSKTTQSLSRTSKGVEGVSIEEKPSSAQPPAKSNVLPEVQKVIQEKLETIKKEITSINIQDIASSSPQFQKIVNDLQSLQQYPRNELKDICTKVCGGL